MKVLNLSSVRFNFLTSKILSNGLKFAPTVQRNLSEIKDIEY